MRKLYFVPALASACLMAVPPSLASPRSEGLDDVRSLVSMRSLAPAPPPDLSDNAPRLMASSVASDPLDHQEARNTLLAARRDAARQHQAGEPASGAPAGPAVAPHLEAIAACESGGNPRAVGGGGAYRGKYQFSPATWQAVGGSGDPAAAPEAEQDRRAATLYAQSGASQWPTCGR